jgi:hypothetical protein
MSNTAEVESFMALVSARRSDLDSGRDFRPTTPPTPHTPGSLVRGRPGSALSARPGSAALGSVSTRAAKFRKDQFQSSNGARTQAAAEEMVRQNRLRELRAPSPRPVTPQLNKSPIKSHGKIADRSALTRAMLANPVPAAERCILIDIMKDPSVQVVPKNEMFLATSKSYDYDFTPGGRPRTPVDMEWFARRDEHTEFVEARARQADMRGKGN